MTTTTDQRQEMPACGVGPPHPRMSHITLFCPGCNAKFAVPAGQTRCPQCGQPLLSAVDAPTSDLEQWDGWGTQVAGEAFAEDEPDDLIGRQLAHYRVDAFLGKGGMARVYRATHLTLERPCALKVLNPHLLARDADYLSLFFAEARAAAALVHPNVVTIHSLAQDAGLHLIEMEYVVGSSLQRMLERERRLDATRATGLMVQVCAALDVAHGLGIIHRDIKPANIMVTDQDVAKLADFGLAKRVAAGSRLARRETLAGTPYFMAPELFSGTAADKRSDVYAMGVTYFELLTGQLPFVDTSVARLADKHAEQMLPCWPDAFPHVPSAATHVIERCLAKNPDDRYADAGELYRELRAAYGSLRTLASLIDESLQGLACEVTQEGDHFRIRVHLPHGRSQTVFVTTSSAEAIADSVVKIFSICGDADPSHYEGALRLNAALPHGSIAIETLHGKPHFIMSNAHARATCDPSEIHNSVAMIARYSDEVEKWLSVEDRH